MEAATDQSENLSDFNVTRRLRAGIAILIVTLGLALVLRQQDELMIHRLGLFPLFFLANNSLSQALHRTCGLSALRGYRHTPKGKERIANRAVLAAVRRRGRLQLLHAFVSACIMTGMFAWLG